MSIKIHIGDTALDERGDFRVVEIVGRHFSDYEVICHETQFNDDCEEIGENTYRAILTQSEINHIFGRGQHVTLVEEDSDDD